VRLFQTLGANPTPMALSDVFVGLQTGVIDGQENPLAQIWGSKLYEVQEYLSLTGHVYTPAYVVVSPARFGALPEEVRVVLEEEARAVQEYVHETAARLDRELLEEIRNAGVAVNTPEPAAFLTASQGVYEEYGRTVPNGVALVERATAAGSR
jgi:TRAP-type C4-dicarboxylate transport system substrate-binding protein